MATCRTLATLLALASVAVTPLPARAQRPTLDGVAAGARVRLSAWSGQRTTGRLVGRSGDTLVVLPAERVDTLRIALDGVRLIEVRDERRPRTLVGALLGLAGGITIGALVGAATSDASGMLADMERTGDALTWAAYGGIAGAGIGGLLGSRIRERWRPIELSPARTSTGG